MFTSIATVFLLSVVGKLGADQDQTRFFNLTSLSSSVYYNLRTHNPFRVVSIENNVIEGTGPFSTRRILRRVGFRSNGCTCHELTCGCCLGINLQQFNFNREGCMNFTYDPEEFAVHMDMLLNENPVFSNTFSARNPPPLCIPITMPYDLASAEFCGRVFDIHTPGQNLQMCFDFETRLFHATVLVLHFDCMRMGASGVAVVKPGDPLPFPATTEDSQVDSDIYDEVTESIQKRPKRANGTL